MNKIKGGPLYSRVSFCVKKKEKEYPTLKMSLGNDQ